MTRTALILGLAALALSGPGPSAFPAPPAPQEIPAPEFPAGVDVVNVDVVVLDRDGNPIEGLTHEDFTVRDEDRIRPVTRFEAVTLTESTQAPPPLRAHVSTNTVPDPRPERTFVIVFDNVHMSEARAEIAKREVGEFMVANLTDGDRVVLIPTSGGAWWSARMPDGRQDVVAALGRLQGERPRVLGPDRISDYEAMRLYVHRDNMVGSEVIRRFYENRVILEPPGFSTLAQPEVLDLGEGHPLIRIKSAEVYQAARTRKQATFNVLERVSNALANEKGRKAILLVSEGFIQEEDFPEFKDVVRAARQANAVIYFIDARGLGGLPLTADAEYADPTDLRDLGNQIQGRTRESLGAVSMAVDTGGYAIRNSNDLARAMGRIDRESRAYYLIGFGITDVKRDGKFHKIKVDVNVPGAKVMARKGYYAPSDEPRKPLAPDELDPGVRAAIDSPFEADSIPLRMSSYVLGSEGGEATVLFTADIDPSGLAFEKKGDRHEDVLSTFLLVSSRDTGETWHREREVELSLPEPLYQQIRQRWLPLMRDFKFGPGTYQARFFVRDQQGNVGTVRHEFEVPAPGEFRVSTPILTDALQPATEGSGPRPIPLARRDFPAGTTLYLGFEVFGAQAGPGGAPQVLTGYRVESLDGKVIGSQPRAELTAGPGGALSQMYSLNLTGLAPGDYLLILEVDDQVAGQTLEVPEIFGVQGG